MKIIYKIAKSELKTLFFSPIAWLILVIFAFQAGLVFTELFEGNVRRVVLGWKLYQATINTFGEFRGLFTIVQGFLYLYIPLLTMGVMSREFSSGSIKLLYSSPLKSWQIVFGKYLALVIYALVLIGILGVFSTFGAIVITHADIPLILTGLLGLFLLTCAYAAIGLFMSSLTSYTVVSAMGTLAIFAVLAYVKDVGQEIEFVRDITYWLAISGRSYTFINGLITSEDVLYFLLVIGMFLGFTVIKLQNSREKKTFFVTFGKYFTVFAAAMIMGYFSAKPYMKVFYDATITKLNTLTKSSQEVVKQLKTGLTITTYTNMLDENFWAALPAGYKNDVDRFKQYIRFKPDIKMKYEYYYHDVENKQLTKQYPTLNADEKIDTLIKMYNWKFKIKHHDEIKDQADLSGEAYHFTRSLVTDNGKQTFLRLYNDMQKFPSEAEITAAFKRLALDSLPTVGFLTGHGERVSNLPSDRAYNMFAQEKTFRYALINQGFDFTDVTLDKPIPAAIRMLIIAEVRKTITPEEMINLNEYIARGGNLIIAGEPGRQQHMNPIVEQLGVRFLPGTLVKPTINYSPDLMLMKISDTAVKFSHHFRNPQRYDYLMPMSGAVALELNENKGFQSTVLFTSDSSGSWNELQTTDFIDDTARLNPELGEVEKPFPTVVALSRQINNKTQKIMVMGDADCLSNGELMMSRLDVSAANFPLISAAFFWLTDEELPADMRRPTSPDTSVRMGKTGWDISNIALKWLFPIGLGVIGAMIWVRRKGR